MSESFSFEIQCNDPVTLARRGHFVTPHGRVETPAFMPVGTQGTVKGVTMDQVRSCGAHIILGNTYHLALRPGDEIVEKLGGLHEMSGWHGPILTDSGGFQVFSLDAINEVTEHAATFRSHIDGAKIELTPERSIEIQQRLGSDIAMVLDHVVSLPSEREIVEDAMERSIRWAARCLAAADRPEQALFSIVQGGLDIDLRIRCAEALSEMPFDGFAVGGLSVGETPPEMYRITEATTPALPVDRPRYLMGVGTPIDLVECVARGIDMFDCVMPTRNGRNGLAFTEDGRIKLRNAVHRDDVRPIDEDCPCLACRHSRGYLRHLFIAGEMLGPILLSIHNLTFYQRLMTRIRSAIEAGTFAEFAAEKRQLWSSKD